MIGAIKRRWKSNKKCSDKDKEKVTPLPSFPPGAGPGLGQVTSSTGPSAICHRLRKGPPLPPVDFIHVNSGRIELHPGANGEKDQQQLLWGQHLHYETRHSWCGPQQMGVPDKQQQQQHQQQLGTRKDVVLKKVHHQSDQSSHHHQEVLILQRLAELEKASKGLPNLEPVLTALKEEVTASVGRQEKLVSDLESLHLRVHTLETNNKALANIILPTLIRLTKEKSSSQTVSSGSSSLKKVAVATSPIKIASVNAPTPTLNSEGNHTPTKMRSNLVPPTTPTKIPAKPKPIPNKKKPGSLELKKPAAGVVSTPPPTKPPFSTSTSTYTTTECRIPFFRPNPSTNSTTHPPKTAISKSKPKSKLPVRKSSSSSGPSTSTATATPTGSGIPTFNSNPAFLLSSSSSKTKKLSSPLIIENKMRFDPKRGGPVASASASVTSASGLPPKDEGYSTMSNGAIDAGSSQSQLPIETSQPQPHPLSSATFNRPKKVGESSSGSPNNGTWTKNKNNKKLATTSPTSCPPPPLPSSPSPSTGRTFATATLAEPGASITTTRENVRIVRGLPTEIRFSSQSSDDYSGGTVLLEDSDDSDILFLPIEVSSTSGSDSTLVPYPYSRSPRSRSTSASRSRSRSRYNTDTANSTSDSTSTYYTAQQGGTTTDSSDTTSTPTPTPTPTHARKKIWSGNNNHIHGGNSAPWDAVGLEVDEQDLVQRWMRLEDMRNEEEAVGDEEQLQLWSWDWDGIIHSNASNNRKDSRKQIQIPSSSETLDVHQPPNHRLSKDFELWDKNSSSVSPRGHHHHHHQSRGKPSKLPSPVDSSTWTKSKRKSFLDTATTTTPLGHHQHPSPSPSLTLTTDSQEGVPPLLTSELDFTAEFYRLTSSGTEDKINQTENLASSTSTSSSLEEDYISGEAPAEPLSEQESDLFLQCKNCLEKMSKLISLQQQQDNVPSLLSLQVPQPQPRPMGDEERHNGCPKLSISEQFAQLLKMNNSHHTHTHSHNHHQKPGKEGSASKWLPVPRSSFRASPQGDRHYTLLSSTESEGLVSPSME